MPENKRSWHIQAAISEGSRAQDVEGSISEITKTREKNSEFQRLIDNDSVFTCEKHVKPDDIEICK